jgi:hypothetical protein
MKKKTTYIVIAVVAFAVLALAVHLFGSDIVATARQHLSGIGL